MRQQMFRFSAVLRRRRPPCAGKPCFFKHSAQASATVCWKTLLFRVILHRRRPPCARKHGVSAWCCAGVGHRVVLRRRRPPCAGKCGASAWCCAGVGHRVLEQTVVCRVLAQASATMRLENAVLARFDAGVGHHVLENVVLVRFRAGVGHHVLENITF